MRIISHRGNISGPESSNENSPHAIDFVLSQGFECEVDLWQLAEERLYLGHDFGQYLVDLSWIMDRSEKLWIHCKNFNALSFLISIDKNLNIFWHQQDDHVLTSQGYIWSYPGKLVDSNSIGVLPEIWEEDQLTSLESCQGVCTDYPRKFDLELNGSTLR